MAKKIRDVLLSVWIFVCSVALSGAVLLFTQPAKSGSAFEWSYQGSIHIAGGALAIIVPTVLILPALYYLDKNVPRKPFWQWRPFTSLKQLIPFGVGLYIPKGMIPKDFSFLPWLAACILIFVFGREVKNYWKYYSNNKRT